MKKKVHILSHTHWDREWYINSKYVNEWLPVFFDGLFKMMEKEPEYRFMLDGQTSMLDDCWAELEKQGRSVEEFRERVAHYASRGQLILGPYYLQPDWQLVSGEALVRNMMIGRRMAAELGGGVSTGWLLDNFGQISQAPQLHRQFGMKGIVVWRGVELDPFHLTSEFEWVGADGTSLTCGYLLSSYRNAMHLADYPEILYDRIRNETEKIAPFSTTGQILLMNGYDQEMRPDDILPYIQGGKANFDDYEVCQSTPGEFMDALRAHRGDLPQLHGALYSGRYISVFPGVLSSRMYLKLMNDEAQRELEQYAEPLCTICAALGKPYPHQTLERAWKKLLKNHPHDSICGVSVDDVHLDMVERFQESLSLARVCTAQAASWLNTMADTSAQADAKAVFSVYNTLPFARTVSVFLPCEDPGSVCVRDEQGGLCPAQPGIGGVTALVPVAPTGMRTVGLFRGEGSPQSGSGQLCAENEYLRVACMEDGTFTVTDKGNGRTYTGIGALEDSADSGDEYNYSFLTGDRPRTTFGVPAQISVEESGPVRTVFRVRRVWNLPESLNRPRDARSAALREMPVETTATLTRGDPVLRFHTSVRNTCRDHRVRVLFPTDLETDTSFAQTQFDVTRHPIRPQAFDNSGIPETVKRVIIGARESMPITQFPQKDFCALTDGAVTAAVVNRGLPEYEVLPDRTTVALTLFRSVGWLTRFDLNTRIGDAGPEMFTPDAQCLRDMEFRYGFCSLAAAPDGCELDRAAQSFVTPALVARNDPHKGIELPAFLSLEAEGAAHLTALKCAENSCDGIVRLYNPSSGEARVRITCPLAQSACEAALYEESRQELPMRGDSVELTLAPREIRTIRMRFKPARAGAEERQAACVWHDEPASCDLSAWEIPDCVTEEDVQGEERRAREAEERYRRQKEQADRLAGALRRKDSSAKEKEAAATAIMCAHADHRAALEARLSALFTAEALKRLRWGGTSQRFLTYQKSLEPALRDCAYALNLARIDKRVSEYITDYYTHQRIMADRPEQTAARE